MVILHCTNKLLKRIGRPDPALHCTSTTALGSWYATALFWRPQVALFVNEITLLPLFVPLAPASTLVSRFVDGLAAELDVFHIPHSFIAHEVEQMAEHKLAKTANRSVVGTMNEFEFLAEAHRDSGDELNLLRLSVDLAGTPCGPLRSRTGFPDRELQALVAGKA
jgi:hypothetical protein